MKNVANKKAELNITKEFNAPVKILFNAFAESEALAEWWGPPGVPITVVKLDFRPKGIFHYKAAMNGNISWGRFIYGQISKYDLIEFISSFSDEQGGITRAPFNDKFPLEVYNRIALHEQLGKTTITLTGYPINATEEEMEFFNAMTEGIRKGFAGTLAQLENYLAKKH